METVSQSSRCSACGESWPLNHLGPCPKCGDTRKVYDVHTEGSLRLHGSLGWKYIHEYYERHPILLPLVLAITVGSPFLGLVLAGWLGVVVGLVIGVVAFILGLRAVTKVREIREGHEP